MKSFDRPVILIALLLSLSPTAQGQVSTQERNALIEFYQATDGDNWAVNQDWLGPQGTECDWYGVYCTDPEHTPIITVFGLDLRENTLSGTLPESLGDLESLRFINLESNSLSGPLPSDLWGLQNLRNALLSGNHFSGAVPAAALNDPMRLFRAERNALDGYSMPIEASNSPAERLQLDLSGNQLTNLPPVEWWQVGAIEELDLSQNRIQGALDLAQTSRDKLVALDLSGNRIESIKGLSALGFEQLFLLDLSNNQLRQWPVFEEPMPQLYNLNLSQNQLENNWPDDWSSLANLLALNLNENGINETLPASFAELELSVLHVDNNDIPGPIDVLLSGLSSDTDQLVKLFAANNRLDGSLPETFDYDRFRWSLGEHGLPTLDLCGNNLILDNPELVSSLNIYHRADSMEGCQNLTEQEIDATISGTWFDPERPGEGITQMLLDNGSILTYWFTFPYESYGSGDEQRWYFGQTPPFDSGYRMKPLMRTFGQFGSGLIRTSSSNPLETSTWINALRLDEGTMQFFYESNQGGICFTGMCSYYIDSQRFSYAQLSRLAGTRCDNQLPQQWISGVWFDPSKIGEGFIVEVNEDGRGIVYWFTYHDDDSGHQAWMTGDAFFDGNTLHIDPLLQPTGTNFGSNFASGLVALNDWGSLTLQFLDDANGLVSYDSDINGYGSGSYPIERLARPMLAVCE